MLGECAHLDLGGAQNRRGYVHDFAHVTHMRPALPLKVYVSIALVV